MHQSTPLHFAVLANNYINAKLLLDNGALVNHKDIEGNTPLHLAVANKNLQIVKLLDSKFADATIKNIDDISALDLALNEDIREIKRYFLGLQKYKAFV